MRQVCAFCSLTSDFTYWWQKASHVFNISWAVWWTFFERNMMRWILFFIFLFFIFTQMCLFHLLFISPNTADFHSSLSWYHETNFQAWFRFWFMLLSIFATLWACDLRESNFAWQFQALWFMDHLVNQNIQLKRQCSFTFSWKWFTGRVVLR